MKCQKCGNEIANGTAFCPSCGAPVAAPAQGQGPAPAVEMSTKSKVVYDVLGFFFGFFRVHDFYRGKIGAGIANIIGELLVLAVLSVGFGPIGVGLVILIIDLQIGIELITVKKDAQGKLMQGSNVAGIILGILTIIAGLIIAGILMATGAAVLAASAR